MTITMTIVLLAAVISPPSCPAPVGEPIAITSTPLPVEKLGGSQSKTTADQTVGQLDYNWGVMLRSDDTRFVDLRYHRGAVFSDSSGCWFTWNIPNTFNFTGPANGRIGKAAFYDWVVEHQAAYWPQIPGYRFIIASEVHTGGYAWLGVWNAEGSAERSQIIVYDGQRHTVLATLPLRVGGMMLLPHLHTASQSIILIGEGKHKHPIPWIDLTWSGR